MMFSLVPQEHSLRSCLRSGESTNDVLGFPGEDGYDGLMSNPADADEDFGRSPGRKAKLSDYD